MGLPFCVGSFHFVCHLFGQNYDSSEYKSSIDFEGLQEITDDELANLFNDNDDFASFSDDLMFQGGDF